MCVLLPFGARAGGEGGAAAGAYFYFLSLTHQQLSRTASLIASQVGEVSGVLDTARRILRGMSRREIQNKVAVGVFAVAMIGIIALLIWWINKPK